ERPQYSSYIIHRGWFFLADRSTTAPFRFPVILRQGTTTQSTCCVPPILVVSTRLRSEAGWYAASGGRTDRDGLSCLGSPCSRRPNVAHGAAAGNRRLSGRPDGCGAQPRWTPVD